MKAQIARLQAALDRANLENSRLKAELQRAEMANTKQKSVIRYLKEEKLYGKNK
jgi:predicted 2-oxoglutarate/Fe(II)-dependent dioxygenase YbiX